MSEADERQQDLTDKIATQIHGLGALLSAEAEPQIMQGAAAGAARAAARRKRALVLGSLAVVGGSVAGLSLVLNRSNPETLKSGAPVLSVPPPSAGSAPISAAASTRPTSPDERSDPPPTPSTEPIEVGDRASASSSTSADPQRVVPLEDTDVPRLIVTPPIGGGEVTNTWWLATWQEVQGGRLMLCFASPNGHYCQRDVAATGVQLSSSGGTVPGAIVLVGSGVQGVTVRADSGESTTVWECDPMLPSGNKVLSFVPMDEGNAVTVEYRTDDGTVHVKRLDLPRPLIQAPTSDLTDVAASFVPSPSDRPCP